MSVLIVLSEDIFENKNISQSYFADMLRFKEEKTFNHKNHFREIKKGDTIYFAYKKCIIAKAIYVSSIKIDDDEYPNKHTISNVEIIDSKEINFREMGIKGRSIRYLDQVKKQKIDEILDSSLYPNEKEDKRLYEGAKKVISVNRYERDPTARQKCINYHGTKCLVCKFDFEETFGDIGKNFIHVHHITPLSNIQEEYEVNPKKDLIPLCPNCHAMIHKQKDPMYSVEDLQNIINRNKS